jgi:hypothetical protein
LIWPLPNRQQITENEGHLKVPSTLFFLFLSHLLISCSSPILQLAEVRSTNCSHDDNYLFLENDTLQVVYVFWAENGVMGVFLHNKTEYPLYVDWKKSSFIAGEIASAYWQDSETISTNSSSSTISVGRTRASSTDYWYTNFLGGTGRTSGEKHSGLLEHTSGNSVTRITKPERVTFIPPHVTISIAAYNVLLTGIPLAPAFPVVSRDTTLFLPPKGFYTQPRPMTCRMSIASFGPTDSPLSFRSFITYSTDEKFTRERYLDTKFYLSRITEMSQSAFAAQPDSMSARTNEGNMWASPTSFYLFTTNGFKAHEH